MIVCDSKKLIFLHIPKNAGSNIRNQLKYLETVPDEFNRICTYEGYGKVHETHMPLFFIEHCYPDLFNKLVDYDVIAILRDPYDRFLSSVNQRLREFKGFAQSQISDSVIIEESRSVASKIQSEPDCVYDLEFMHFIPQNDFIQIRELSVVDRLFDFKNLNDLVTFFQSEYNIDINLGGSATLYNATVDIKFSFLKPLVKVVRPLIAKVPKSAQDSLRDLLIRLKVYGRSNMSRSPESILPADVLDFIESFYKADIASYKDLIGRE